MGTKEQEKREPMVKGVALDIEDKATALVVDGAKAGKSDDDLKTQVFSLGVPFSKLNRLFVAIKKAHGLYVDVEKIKQAISEKLDAAKLSFGESHADLKSISDAICKEVPHATEGRVMAQLRTRFKENETEFPRKVATKRGRMGVINKTIIDTFKANKDASPTELFEALKKVTKADKNAEHYAKSFHTLAYALANGLSSLEVLTVIAKKKEEAEKASA